MIRICNMIERAMTERAVSENISALREKITQAAALAAKMP